MYVGIVRVLLEYTLRTYSNQQINDPAGISTRSERLESLAYEKILEKIHLDSAGKVVDPFVSLEDRVDREERQRWWIESLNRDKQDSRRLIN